ncbi:hypothetical protein [Anaerococcus sp. AGMB09787]|uniref:hypothetical protein n=1 Tax=Anaerococcus sp. AGMB09787 TaxID=2922869 RepID=UPI001FAF986C|nr:hypothetical protein [Anaerococcus sp. AGMB09787]
MKEKFKNNFYLVSLILFVATIVLNYMSSLGIILPYTQQEISDMYPNLLAPAPITFSIWGVIYIGMIISFVLPFIKELSVNDKEIYYNKIMPCFIAWELFNIIWTLTWNNDMIAIALVAIILYALSLVYLVNTIGKDMEFYNRYKVFLSIPAGLHTGWLIFASFTNVMTLLVKSGFNGVGFLGIVVTIIMIALACGLELFAFKKTGNAYVTLPALWALIGIAIKQRPGSDFIYSDTLVMLAAIVFFVLALIGHFQVLKTRRIVNGE